MYTLNLRAILRTTNIHNSYNKFIYFLLHRFTNKNMNLYLFPYIFHFPVINHCLTVLCLK